MNYEHITKGIFLERPNRFIAYVEINGKKETCHVKNTGRCKELLIPGTELVLQYHPDAAATGRKTSYDVICVYKETSGNKKLLINMDSQAPNQAAREWIASPVSHHSSGSQKLPAMLLPGSGTHVPCIPTQIQREVTHGDSRFDLAFLLQSPDKKDCRPALMEVKGVTLEQNGTVLFPDAPTERGVKHLKGLAKACNEGFEAYVLFVIQMKGPGLFRPNKETHPAFGQALKEAHNAGVHILAYDCLVTPDSMKIDAPVPVAL